MRRPVRLGLLLAGAALAARAAAARSFPCPERVATTQSLAEKAAGWEVFVDTVNAAHPLERVRFYDGPPSGLADLKPDNGDSSDPVMVWDLAGVKELWQVCVYANTKVSLARRLPAGLKSCRVGPKNEVSCR